MYKKIIYSVMALSITLLPALDAMADVTEWHLDEDTTYSSSNAWPDDTYIINDDTAGYTLTIQGITIDPDTTGSTIPVPNYSQSEGGLAITSGGSMVLKGDDNGNYAIIEGGSVQLGTSSSNTGTLTIGYGAKITSDAQVTINEGSTMNLNASIATGTEPSLILSNYDNTAADIWEGKIVTHGVGTSGGQLYLQGFTSDTDTATAVYQQSAGSLIIGTASVTSGETTTNNYSTLVLNHDDSYISAGSVSIDPGSTLVINSHNRAYEATLGQDAHVLIDITEDTSGETPTYSNPATLKLTGKGTAVLNDVEYSEFVTGQDVWKGNVILGDATSGEEPVLTMRNVTKDFTDTNESATFVQNGGTLNIESNDNGGSTISGYNYYYDPDDQKYYYNFHGKVNIKGDSTNKSTLNMYYGTNDTRSMDTNLLGYANLTLNTLSYTDQTTGETKYTNIITDTPPTGTGAGNTVVKTGLGRYVIGSFDSETGDINPLTSDVKMGYNMQVAQGDMVVYTSGALKVGIDNETGVDNYGYLLIGDENNTSTTNFYTTASSNQIVGTMMLYDGWYHQLTPATTKVGGDFNVANNSGVNMMNGKIDRINVAGSTVVADGSTLNLKIDVDPLRYDSLLPGADSINASAVVGGDGSVLNLNDYNLLSAPRRNYYNFRVVNANGENYNVSSSARKVVTGNATRTIHTSIGDYKMFPSAVKGAFDLALYQFNPQVFRGPVAANVIYANQTAINNQLFDRMFYSNLPYFNGRCTNKTAAADTLYSPYQYTTEDTGLWFKPYANFETIHMNYGLNKVRNNSYGAMVGVDFARKDFGSWSFIPTAFIGYNGGRTTFNGVGMWHNGGQAGFMGTLTNHDFITSAVVYAGGYHNAMSVRGANDSNALWNVGVASKTAYNLHLFWDLILQPNLYLAYNYIGSSDFESKADGLFYKTDPMNAFSVAPGVNLIWQKETFSIYALFQAMFNINSTIAGRVAEVDMPHVGIKDPYFEYGLGATKFFKDRFSGYGQVVARSGSRKGVGFQLGLNLKL